MTFKKDIPNYKQFINLENEMSEIPKDAFAQLEALFMKASGGESGPMQHIINALSPVLMTKTTTNWGASYLITDFKNLTNELKLKVENGKYHLFMDCLQTMVQNSDRLLTEDDVNEFLDDHGIGYVLNSGPGFRLEWECASNSMTAVKPVEELLPVVKKVSVRAFEHLQSTIDNLSRDNTNQQLKYAVRDCATAMEGVIKTLGGENDIKKATKIMRDSQQWGLSDIVKDGEAIFNKLHHLYPDFRHGTQDDKSTTITYNEAKYWISRMCTFLDYIISMEVEIN